jgi:hypothetical protein
MGTLGGFAAPFGPPPAAVSPLASPCGDFGTCTFPTTPARYARALALGLANPSRDGAPPSEPAGSPRDRTEGLGGGRAGEQELDAILDRQLRLLQPSTLGLFLGGQ